MEITKKINNKSAFTLAEVLITIVIIGIIASMTIPSIIAKHSTKALETQNKKAMSVLSNGFRMLMVEEGVTDLRNTKIVSCDTNDKECFADEIKRVFNVALDNISDNDVFHTKYTIGGVTYTNFWNDHAASRYTFVTTDGMIFGVDTSGDGRINMHVDINGVKKPNMGALDLCRYSINNNGGIVDRCSTVTSWR